jgi:hypothetical protein
MKGVQQGKRWWRRLQQFPMFRMYEERVGGMMPADFDHQLLAKRAL